MELIRFLVGVEIVMSLGDVEILLRGLVDAAPEGLDALEDLAALEDLVTIWGDIGSREAGSFFDFTGDIGDLPLTIRLGGPSPFAGDATPIVVGI